MLKPTNLTEYINQAKYVPDPVNSIIIHGNIKITDSNGDSVDITVERKVAKIIKQLVKNDNVTIVLNLPDSVTITTEDE